MHRLVLIRHGESTWNKENRFTGWTDVDLSERGVNEAKQAGQAKRDICNAKANHRSRQGECNGCHTNAGQTETAEVEEQE